MDTLISAVTAIEQLAIFLVIPFLVWLYGYRKKQNFFKWIGEKLGFLSGNTIQAVLFGLIHGLPTYQATGNMGIAIALTITPAMIGWMMGYINEKYASGSIMPGWLMHGICNFCSAVFVAF